MERARSEAARPLPSGAAQGEEDMRDEYGDMDDDLGETCVVDKFELESGHMMSKVGDRRWPGCCALGRADAAGASPDQVQVRYMRWGELNAARDNALVVCHALTGNGARP